MNSPMTISRLACLAQLVRALHQCHTAIGSLLARDGGGALPIMDYTGGTPPKRGTLFSDPHEANFVMELMRGTV